MCFAELGPKHFALRWQSGKVESETLTLGSLPQIKRGLQEQNCWISPVAYLIPGTCPTVATTRFFRGRGKRTAEKSCKVTYSNSFSTFPEVPGAKVMLWCSRVYNCMVLLSIYISSPFWTLITSWSLVISEGNEFHKITMSSAKRHFLWSVLNFPLCYCVMRQVTRRSQITFSLLFMMLCIFTVSSYSHPLYLMFSIFSNSL